MKVRVIINQPVPRCSATCHAVSSYPRKNDLKAEIDRSAGTNEMKNQKPKIQVYRSAANGRFVTKQKAVRSPRTTFKDTIRQANPKKKK